MPLGRYMISTVMLAALVLGVTACLTVGATAASQGDATKPLVVLETSMGAITLELDQEKAPITVENFLKYVDSGFYDNLVFHRVIQGFMIQGGGMNEQMQEKGKNLQPIKNESGNGLHNERGTIAMARTNNPNSATCQFFINHRNNAQLDTYGGGYAVFGKVVDGIEVVDAIAKVPVTTKGDHENVPVTPVVIKSAKRKGK